MILARWVERVASHRRAVILVALLTTFAGVGLLLDRPKGSLLAWLAAPLLAVGGALFAWAVWPPRSELPDVQPTLAGNLLRWMTWHGRLVPLFPAVGAAILLVDIAYNAKLSASPAFGTEDTIAILAGASLIAYNLVPKRYARERDFVLMFFLTLNAILVVPLLIARAYYADFERSVNVYSWVALAPQTSAALSLFGVANTVHAVGGSTAPGLTFQPQHLPIQVTLVITTACSGIYSFGIFASAFVAFVVTEYQRVTRRVWCLLGLGLITAYFANVLRMVVIVLVGYYTDTAETDLQNMLVAHSYLGWVIFLGWITLFWATLFKFLIVRPEPSARTEPRKRGVRCGVCDRVLTPALPGYRCECGKFYHAVCAMTRRDCPQCQQPMKVPEAGELGTPAPR
jgi:archaeosortase C (PEF-CTERM variant)